MKENSAAVAIQWQMGFKCINWTFSPQSKIMLSFDCKFECRRNAEYMGTWPLDKHHHRPIAIPTTTTTKTILWKLFNGAIHRNRLMLCMRAHKHASASVCNFCLVFCFVFASNGSNLITRNMFCGFFIFLSLLRFV